MMSQDVSGICIENDKVEIEKLQTEDAQLKSTVYADQREDNIQAYLNFMV